MSNENRNENTTKVKRIGLVTGILGVVATIAGIALCKTSKKMEETDDFELECECEEAVEEDIEVECSEEE